MKIPEQGELLRIFIVEEKRSPHDIQKTEICR